jgi:hypothetical protein
MSGTPRHLSSHIRTHRLRSDRSKVCFSESHLFPIILLDNVSGFHRRLLYDILGWDGELDRMTTSPSDIVGTGFSLVSHPHSPFTSVPNLGTSLATRRRAYCISINSDDRLSSRSRSTFLFLGLSGFLNLSLRALSRITTISPLRRDPRRPRDFRQWTTQRLPTLITSNPSGKGGEIGLSIHAYHHISSIPQPHLIGPGYGSPMDPPATGRWRSAILLLLGLSISLSLFLGFMGSRFTIRCLVRI